MKPHTNTLIVILGPTAVGKTALAISMAQHFNTEIISADARQFYKEMNIGTAKPTAQELKAVRHHFINSLSVKDNYDANSFEKDALNKFQNIFTHHPYAVLVGGSGMYIDAVCNGMDTLPPSDSELRTELQNTLQNKGIVALQQQLKVLDPIYHSRVDLLNAHRLIRALEVCLLTGKPYSSYRTGKTITRPFHIIKVGLDLPRNELYERINNRVDQMMKSGLLEEVRSLLPFRDLNALNTVGYKELFEHLDGNITLPDAINKIKQNTRNYAKRQLTWFKRDKNIKWFQPEDVNEIIAYIESF